MTNDTLVFMFLMTKEESVTKISDRVKKELNLKTVMIEKRPVSYRIAA